jgi:SAM-dependent methyltransferase
VDGIGLVERLYYACHARGDVVERLRAQFPSGVALRTLDFGGGSGRVSRALADLSPGTFVVVDIDDEALRLVPRGSALRAVLVQAEGRLPFRAGSFDRIIMVDVLHEVANGTALLKELARLLAPGGELLVVDLDGLSFLTSIFGWIARLTGRRCLFRTEHELRADLARLGLEVATERIDGLRFLGRAH